MADVRVTISTVPSSGSSAIDRIEYRLDQDDATIATAPLTAPGVFDIVVVPDAEDRAIELGQWNQTQFSGWSPVKSTADPIPDVVFVSNLDARSVAIGSPVGRIDFNDGLTLDYSSGWALSPLSPALPTGASLLINGRIPNFDVTEAFDTTIIARLTAPVSGGGTFTDVSIALQFGAAAIPLAIDTFIGTNADPLSAYVGPSTLPWTDQRGLGNSPEIFNVGGTEGQLFADPDNSFFSYYRYDTAYAIGDDYIRADIRYGSGVNKTGTYKSVAQIGLAMSGDSQSGVFFGYRAEYDRWELRRITLEDVQSSVFVDDATFAVAGQTRTIALGRNGSTFTGYVDSGSGLVDVLSFTDILMGSGAGGFRLIGYSEEPGIDGVLGDDMSFDNLTWPADPTYAITATVTPTMSNFGSDTNPIDALSANALLNINYSTNVPGATAVVEVYTRYVNDVETPEGEESFPVSVGDVVRFEITVGDGVIDDVTFVTTNGTAVADTFSMIRKRDEFIASSITAPTTLQEPLGAPWLTRTPLSGTWPFTLTTADLTAFDAKGNEYTTPVPMVDPVLEVPGGAVVGGAINVLPAMFATDGNEYSEEVIYTVQANTSGISGYTNTTLDIVNSYVIRSAEIGKTIRIRAKVKGTLIYSNEEVITAGADTVPDAFIFSNWDVADATTGGTANVTITSLPADGGATITDVEYKVDAGAWTTSGGTVSFSITGLTDDAQVGVMLRAVNAEGNGDDGNVENVTPTTAAGSFTETPVVSAGGIYLTSSTALSDQPALLVFGSFIQPTGIRRHLLSWDGTSGSLRSDSDGGDGANIGPRIASDSGDAGGGAIGSSSAVPVAEGLRMHVLATAQIVGPSPYVVRTEITVWDATSAVWATMVTNDTGTNAGNGPNLYLSNGNLRVLERNNSTGSEFAGTLYRIAGWTFASAASLPDISSSVVRNYFTSGASLVDPATSRAQYDTPFVDLSGSVADWNAGTHDGSLTLTKTGGTFT